MLKADKPENHSVISLKKKLFISILMFMVGWAIGIVCKPPYKPVDNKVSHCNWISKYDYYDYEEAVLKEGDTDKLRKILSECGVDRFPYMIVMYDVYHENISKSIGFWYSAMQEKTHKRNLAANIPLREFVMSVLTEYAEMGDKDGKERLQKLMEDETGE